MGWDLVQEVEATALEAYRTGVERLLAKGYGRKQAREVARHLLPGGTQTEIVVTGNHRAWYEMLTKRLAPGDDVESQRLAQDLLSHLKKLVPSMYRDLGCPGHSPSGSSPSQPLSCPSTWCSDLPKALPSTARWSEPDWPPSSSDWPS